MFTHTDPCPVKTKVFPPFSVADGEPEYCSVYQWRFGKRREEQGCTLQAAHPEQIHLLQSTHAEQTSADG